MENVREVVRLDRRLTWLPQIHIGRNRSGDAVVHVPMIAIWAKRLAADESFELSGQNLVKTETERAYRVRYALHVVVVPMEKITEVGGALSARVPADGRVRVSMKPDDRLTEGAQTLRVNRVEELDRGRWLMVHAEVIG